MRTKLVKHFCKVLFVISTFSLPLSENEIFAHPYFISDEIKEQTLI